MTKRIIALLLMLTAANSFAQEAVLFKAQLQPNKNYKTKITSTANSKIEIQAGEEFIEMMKSMGEEPSTVILIETDLQSEMMTQQRNEKGELAAAVSYGDAATKTTVNGEIQNEENPLSGVRVLGRYDAEDAFIIDSVEGNRNIHLMKDEIQSIAKELQEIMAFPVKPMKVGDSFTSEKPVTLPWAGNNPLTVNVLTETTLVKIEGPIALFDIRQVVSTDSENAGIKLIASGTGTGRSEYNMTENYLTSYNTKLPLVASLQMGDEMTIKMDMDLSAVYDVEIN